MDDPIRIPLVVYTYEGDRVVIGDVELPNGIRVGGYTLGGLPVEELFRHRSAEFSVNLPITGKRAGDFVIQQTPVRQSLPGVPRQRFSPPTNNDATQEFRIPKDISKTVEFTTGIAPVFRKG